MNFPRVMISAVSSGSGKTLITCGLLQALKNRDKKVAAFKCGPDYIDPMFHKKVIKVASKNLDSFFTEERITKHLFVESAKHADISVIEGVMGYYDGVGGISDWGSSYELAKQLECPVILIISAKGMSLSIAAIIKGFQEFRTDSNIKGVILNQVSPMFYPEIKKTIEQALPVTVLGYVPRVEELVLESRHLGLVMPDEIQAIEEKIEKLAKLLEQTIDFTLLLKIANQASELDVIQIDNKKLSHSPRIAVAQDEAFCFYYEDNLSLMKKMGATIVPFSPIHDKELPLDIQGILLGGGYPELYAKELSNNQTMRKQILEYVKENRPILAECGGFMYLHDTMEDSNKVTYEMVGAIHGHVYKTEKLGRFGYIELISKKNDNLIEENDKIKGHEFHYFESTNCGEDFLAKKPLRKREWECIHGTNRQCMGFPHLYYYSNQAFIYNFLNECV